MPRVIQFVWKRYQICSSGRRKYSAISLKKPYQRRKIQESTHSLFFISREDSLKYHIFLEENNMIMKSIPHSRSISKSGLGKYETQFLVIESGQ